jgi:hypothetical protein
MAIYTVHSKGKPAEDAIFIRDGFSIAAFLFTVLWALWNRMWIVAIFILVVLGAITVLGEALSINESIVSLASLLASLIFGHEARDLQRWSLERRGYQAVGVVAGEDLEEAELRFFAFQPPMISTETLPPLPVFIPKASGQPEPLGLFNRSG